MSGFTTHNSVSNVTMAIATPLSASELAVSFSFSRGTVVPRASG